MKPSTVYPWTAVTGWHPLTPHVADDTPPPSALPRTDVDSMSHVVQQRHRSTQHPATIDRITYTQVAASALHTVLSALRRHRCSPSETTGMDNSTSRRHQPASPIRKSPPVFITRFRCAPTALRLRSEATVTATTTSCRCRLGSRTHQSPWRDTPRVAEGPTAPPSPSAPTGSDNCNIPQPPAGVVYTQVSASRFNTSCSLHQRRARQHAAGRRERHRHRRRRRHHHHRAPRQRHRRRQHPQPGHGRSSPAPTAGTVTVEPQRHRHLHLDRRHFDAPTRFTYTVKDTDGTTSNAATVTITITAVNDAPVAVNDTATVAEGGTTTIAVSTNDTDADGNDRRRARSSSSGNPPRAPSRSTPNGTVTYANERQPRRAPTASPTRSRTPPARPATLPR